jgi:hypothetical protein
MRSAQSPLMRLTCRTRSEIKLSRSRWSRRIGRTTLQTFGSPRRYAISEGRSRCGYGRFLILSQDVAWLTVGAGC